MTEHTRVLVVDDESQITRVLRTALSAQGYDVRVANDGEMALEIMKDWTPNLIVSDLAMPNLDGVQLTRRVRSSSQIPIIVLSVRDQERTKIEALDAGADDYVTKPFNTNELRELLPLMRGQPPNPINLMAVTKPASAGCAQRGRKATGRTRVAVILAVPHQQQDRRLTAL